MPKRAAFECNCSHCQKWRATLDECVKISNSWRSEAQRLRESIGAAAVDHAVLIETLREALAMLDNERAGKKSSWTHADVKRLEAIRFLSLL